MEDLSSFKVTESCCSSILTAARLGHLNCIQQRIGKRLRSRATEILEAVSVHNSHGSSPLQFSARHGHVECVDLLIDAGADVNWQDWTGETALHYAVRGAALDLEDEQTASCARSLIAAGANVSVKTLMEETALHLAAFFCCARVMKVLLSAGCDVDERDRNGWTALHHVVFNGSENSHTRSTWEGKLECTRMLLAHGASVERSKDLTVLEIACLDACHTDEYDWDCNSEDAIAHVRMLLEAGADPNLCRKDVHIVEHVCMHADIRVLEHADKCDFKAHTALLELLLEHGATLEGIDLNERRWRDHFYTATKDASTDFLRCLLKVPGLQDEIMRFALRGAVKSSTDGVVKLQVLLDAGVPTRGIGGSHALMACVEAMPSMPAFQSLMEMFNILLSNGASPCGPDMCVLDKGTEVTEDIPEMCLCGQSMLHTAVQNGSVAFAEAILKTGVVASLPCDYTLSRYPLITALNVSRVHGPSLVQLLLSHGADPGIVLFQPVIDSSTPSFVKELCPRSIDIRAIMSVLALLPVIPLRCRRHQHANCCKAFCNLTSQPPALTHFCRVAICSSLRANLPGRLGVLEAVRSLPITAIAKDILLAPFGLNTSKVLGD